MWGTLHSVPNNIISISTRKEVHTAELIGDFGRLPETKKQVALPAHLLRSAWPCFSARCSKNRSRKKTWLMFCLLLISLRLCCLFLGACLGGSDPSLCAYDDTCRWLVGVLSIDLSVTWPVCVVLACLGVDIRRSCCVPLSMDSES